MQKYGDLELFPVRVQVPLIFSVKITLNVKHMCMWHLSSTEAQKACSKAPLASMRQPPPASFFAVPDGYTEKALEEHAAFQPVPAESNTNAADTPQDGIGEEDFRFDLKTT